MKGKRETIAEWNGIKLTYDDRLYLAVSQNGRLAGANLSVEKAQEIVNRLAGKAVWTA